MDKLKKLKKENSGKCAPKDKNPFFITDVKSIKENLKIKEILRTVKMNSSMRLKAPPGSKVMNNKDFNDDDSFEETACYKTDCEPLCATNPVVMVNNIVMDNDLQDNSDIESKESTPICETKEEVLQDAEETNSTDNNTPPNINTSEKIVQDVCENSENVNETVDTDQSILNGKCNEKTGERKLSLDHSILSRREGFSQSELDLHSIGKFPLERKSSFFRKTMDSFVKNTTEMFKKQNKSLQRRGSMSVSLHSLNDKSFISNEFNEPPSPRQEVRDSPGGSKTHLHIPFPISRSSSSVSMMQRQSSEQSLVESLTGSQPALHDLSTTTSEMLHSNSVQSLNEAYLKESMLNSRAISMSSGLDSPFGQPRRKASRSNRVTWVASEGLTNYFRRMIQDEKSKEMQSCQSYQDFSSIPENESYNRKPDMKGRRLSYQRAVSGEDPALMTRYHDSSMRRKHQMPEIYESHVELSNYLAGFTLRGVPPLYGYEVANIPEEAFAYLLWATKPENVVDVFEWHMLPSTEVARQAAIRELINTEAVYVKHLMAIVEVFIAAAHALQGMGKMLTIDTAMLFSNLPDVLNASLKLWNSAFMPMIRDAVLNLEPFNTELMFNGFIQFGEILLPYERYVIDQKSILTYYRTNQQDPEFAMYLTWCHSQKECERLQLNDFLVKPMQRLTKYGLLLERLTEHTTTEPERTSLEGMEHSAKTFVTNVNRSIRLTEELAKIAELERTIEPYELPDIKDEEIERHYKFYVHLNLRAPMLYCLPTHARCLIHQGELRFRDGPKEIDARVYLLTDMFLVCRKPSKGNPRMIRPKYMLDKMVMLPKFVSKTNKDLSGLVFLNMDDTGSPSSYFVLSESSKDPNPQSTLRTWENKVKEAKLTYEIMVWLSRNPNRELTDAEVHHMVESLQAKPRMSTDEGIIEQEARERVATMLHKSVAVSSDYDSSQYSTEYPLEIVVGVSPRPPGPHQRGHLIHRVTSVNTPYNSRYSSLQKSTSATSHDDHHGHSRSRRTTISLEPYQPPAPQIPAEVTPSITVQVLSEVDTETDTTVADADRQSSTVQPTPVATPSRSPVQFPFNPNQTLRVQPQNNVATLLYSLPDLTIEPCTPKSTSSPTQTAASDKLYQSHQELIQRHRLSTSQTQQFLSPDHRGISYPPPSPTRGSLQRGLAFSYSNKNPPLSKMGHVSSQGQLHVEPGPSTSYYGMGERSISPQSDKADKKSKLSSSSFFGSGGWHTKRDG